jgi:hypothetical protein
MRDLKALEGDLPSGISRAEAYAKIREDHHVAYNDQYAISRLKPPQSIEEAGAWPPASIPIADGLGRVYGRVRNPDVRIRYEMASTLVCSVDTYLVVEFDAQDRVRSVHPSDRYYHCL